MSLLHHAVCVHSLRSVFRQRSSALIGRRINADRDFSRISYAFTFNFDVPYLAGALINEASFHSSRALGGAYRRRCVARAFANRTCDVSLVSAIRNFVSYYLPLRARESRQARGPLSLSFSFSRRLLVCWQKPRSLKVPLNRRKLKIVKVCFSFFLSFFPVSFANRASCVLCRIIKRAYFRSFN